MWDIKQILTSFTRAMDTNYHRLSDLGATIFSRLAAREDGSPEITSAMIVCTITLVVD